MATTIRFSNETPESRCAAAGLTPDQREVLAMIARGYSNCEIASHRNTTPGTVVNHNQQIYAKLGLREDPRKESIRVKAAMWFWGIQP